MTRAETLREAYEEAAFVLMMDCMARAEGARALEEERTLRADPAAAVPGEVRRACLRAIRRALRARSARAAGRAARKVAVRAALAALLAVLLFTVAAVASPGLRSRVILMFVDSVNESVRFRGQDPDPSAPARMPGGAHPAYVPEGYELAEEGAFADVYWAYYQNEQGDRLEVDISPGGSFDTEGAALEPTLICGLTAYLIDQTEQEGAKHGVIKVIVLSEMDGYLISVTSIPHSNTIPAPIGRAEIVRIAESLFA